MDRNPVLIELVKTASAAVELKRLALERTFRRSLTKAVYSKQIDRAERELANVIAPVIKDQMDDIVGALNSGAKDIEYLCTKETDGADLFDDLQTKGESYWKQQLINATLPVLAMQMAEAAVAQFMTLGVDVRVKDTSGLREKHLPGQHDQSAHGHGGVSV